MLNDIRLKETKNVGKIDVMNKRNILKLSKTKNLHNIFEVLYLSGTEPEMN